MTLSPRTAAPVIEKTFASALSPVDRLPLELIRTVFDMLDGCDLTIAALVCRRWSIQAIHVKWSSRDVPLGALLSIFGDVTSAKPRYSDRCPSKKYLIIHRLTRPLDEKLLAAFKTRASIITSLLVEFGLSDQVLKIMKLGFPDLKHVFGRLKRLYAVIDPRAPVDQLLPFLGHTVKSLTLQGLRGNFEGPNNERGILTDSLKVILATCPQVRDIDIDFYFAGSIDFVLATTALQSLKFHGFFAMEDISDLASSAPNLEDLTIGGKLPQLSSTQVRAVTFPELQSFNIGILANSDLTRLLSTLRMPSLRCLVVDGTVTADRWSFRETVLNFSFLDNIATWSPSLESLAITAYQSNDIGEPFTAIPSLLTFKHMRKIHLEIVVGEEKAADVVNFVPFGMPELEDLTILCRSAYQSFPAGILPQSLVELAVGTKKLRRLQAVLDAKRITDAGEDVNMFAVAHHLEELVLSPALIQEQYTIPVAKVLRRAFPNVRVFEPIVCSRGERNYSDLNMLMVGESLRTHFFELE